MCAYNPGVVDISGQLRAQGKVAQAEGIASGFSGGFATYTQNKLRNQVLQGQNEGLLKAFLADPETAKYAPEGMDKYLTKAEDGGGMSLKDNIFLNGMLNTALNTRGVIEKQKGEAAQRDLMAQQSAELQQRIALQKKQEVDSQESERALQRAATPDQVPYVPAQIPNNIFMRGQGAPPPQTSPSLMGDNQFLVGSTPAAAPIQTPNQPQQQPLTSSEIRMRLAQSGKPLSSSAVKMLDAMGQEEERRAVAAERNSAARGMKVDTIYDVDASGKPVRISVDAASGRRLGAPSPISEPPRAYPTPEEAGATEIAKTSGMESAKSAIVFLDKVSSGAEGAQETMARINNINKLYSAGETSGWGQSVVNSITGAAVQAGLYSADKQAKKEELQMDLSRDALDKAKELLHGQGTISDKERARIDAISAGIGKTEGANKAALSMANAMAQRAIAVEQKRRVLYDSGATPIRIAEELKRYMIDNPLPSFQGLSASATPAPAAVAKSTSLDDLLKKYK